MSPAGEDKAAATAEERSREHRVDTCAKREARGEGQEGMQRLAGRVRIEARCPVKV